MSRSMVVYHELHAEVIRLRQIYAGQRRPVPTDKDLLAGDSYILAAHAAIEFALEEMCRKVIYSALKKYSVGQGVSPCLESIISANHWNMVAKLPSADFAFMSTEQKVYSSVKWYVAKLDSNNGIKRRNILSLLLPLGLTENDLDEVWLSSMDSFGASRGDIAHGRPGANFGRGALYIGIVGSGQKIEVWSQQARRIRTRVASWDADGQIWGIILPGVLNIDRVLLSIS